MTTYEMTAHYNLSYLGYADQLHCGITGQYWGTEPCTHVWHDMLHNDIHDTFGVTTKATFRLVFG